MHDSESGRGDGAGHEGGKPFPLEPRDEKLASRRFFDERSDDRVTKHPPRPGHRGPDFRWRKKASCDCDENSDCE